MFGSFSMIVSSLGQMARSGLQIRHRLWVFNVAAFVLVTACSKDSEADVRELLSGWVHLNDTVYFKSQGSCSAGVFQTDTGEFTEAVVHVTGIRAGLAALRLGATVAFDVPNLNPNQVSEQITSTNLPEGIAVISSGVGGRRCMSDDVARRFFAALTAPEAILIFDTMENVMAVVRPDVGLLYFSRGDV